MRLIWALALCLWAMHGQSAPKFEVASIKLSTADANATSGIRTGKGELDAYNVTLKRCIMGAYGLGPSEIVGGPEWLDSTRFDILAKAAIPTDDDGTLMVMLRELLAERFGLVVQRQPKTMQAYVLEVMKKGPKLEKAESGEGSTNTIGGNGRITIEARKISMDSFARSLARSVDLPVINRTDLNGAFNFKLSWSRDAKDDVSIFTALKEQLGLQLRARKVTVQVLMVDRANKPTEN